MQWILKLDRMVAKGEEILLALLLVGMVVLAAVQVLLRNIWNTGIDWADITLQNVTVLLGLLGAAVATSEGRHLNIDVFSRVLKGRAKLYLRLVIGTFSIAICLLLVKGGWTTFTANYQPWIENIPQGWSATQNFNTQFLEGGLPQWVSQLFLPLGFALIAFHFSLRLILDLGTLATGKAWEQTDQSELEGDAMLEQMAAMAESGPADKGEVPR